MKKIDFPTLAGELLARALDLLPQWLPGGAKQGNEYKGAPTGSGGDGDSWSVNMTTGVWGHFGGDEVGGDLISLFAALNGVDNVEAAKTLIDDYKLDDVAYVQVSAQLPASPSSPAAPQSGGKAAAKAKRERVWEAIAPVPDYAPAPNFRHFHYGDAVGHWEYRVGDVLQGYTVRYDKFDDSGTLIDKEVLPLTFCRDLKDPQGSCKWVNKQWNEPRPMYLPWGDLSQDSRLTPMVGVEGEKCADAGHALIGHEFDFIAWPGGGNGWPKVDWEPARGRIVYLWADCDAKRVKLTAEELRANIDPGTKPIKPEAMQPGVKTMTGLANLLVTKYDCTVYWVPIPKPGAVPDGWDLADAIAEGWDADKVRQQIRAAVQFVSPDEAVRAAVATVPTADASRDGSAGAGQDDAVLHAWRSKLLLSSTGSVKAVRENVVLALDGLPDLRLTGVAEAAGVIAFNEFTNDVVKLKDSPWGTSAGIWDEVDDLLMGEWLTRSCFLPSMPRNTLEEAVRMVGYRHKFHPVRQRFEKLRGTWDQQKRLNMWIRHACLDAADTDPEGILFPYLERVGTWFFMGMVARIMQPGAKFDYMVVFEGPQGVGKSTLASILGGDYHADTGLVLGEKDSYQNLQGVAVYEIGELDGFSKAEISKIKLFISSAKDRFRASFDRRPKDYPRQVVFVGTTNEDHYLVDPTGNRRFWPIRVSRRVDLQWMRDNLDQMLAEALFHFDAGDRFHPTPKEQKLYFTPQQELRTVESAIESKLMDFLQNDRDGQLLSEVSLVEILGKIGIGIEKLGPGRFHEKQAAAALRRMNWEEGRRGPDGSGFRPRVFKRPSAAGASGTSSSTGHAGHSEFDKDRDDCPF